MSYVRLQMAYRNILKSCRFMTVPIGATAPLPVAGYNMTSRLFTESENDYYLEYREVEGDIIPL